MCLPMPIAVLNKKSGLLGVSGHNDLRTIIELKVCYRHPCYLVIVYLLVGPSRAQTRPLKPGRHWWGDIAMGAGVWS
jgi:hypothetical protein